MGEARHTTRTPTDKVLEIGATQSPGWDPARLVLEGGLIPARGVVSTDKSRRDPRTRRATLCHAWPASSYRASDLPCPRMIRGLNRDNEGRGVCRKLNTLG